MRSVGVMGDSRTYDYTLALRGVTTTDFMTADWARIPYDVLDRASARIVNEVHGIDRVVYDITSKPPSDDRVGIMPERLKSLENAGLLRYGIAP